MRDLQGAGGAALSTDDAAAGGPVPAPVAASGPRRRAVAVLLATALLIVALDVLTKQLAVSRLENRPPVRLLDGAVYLTLVRNSGAAFSIGTNHTPVFPIITIVVVAWIAWMAARLRSTGWALALGLVLGGALGNLGDRLFRAPGPLFGRVVDFVSVFDEAGRVFPVFNVADSALSIGVVLAVLLELSGRRRDGTRAAGRQAASGDGQAALPAVADSQRDGG